MENDASSATEERPRNSTAEPPTVVFASASPMLSHLQFAAALRRRGCRVVRVVHGKPAVLQPERLIERLVFHAVLPGLGDRSEPEPRTDTLAAFFGPDLVDIQAEDQIAEVLARRCGDLEGFPRRTGPGIEERDLYDKLVMSEHAAASGWTIPRTWSVAEANEAPWPRLVKPRLGNGGVGVRLVSDPDEFAEAVAESPNGRDTLLVQEFIAGQIVRIGGIAHHGSLLQWATYDCWPPADDPFGPSFKVEVTHHPELVARASDLLGRLRYTGTFCIDCIRSQDGVPTFLELNARIWGAWAAVDRSGTDFAGAYLAVHGIGPEGARVEAEPAPPIPLNSIRRHARNLGWRWAMSALLLRSHHAISEFLLRRNARRGG